MQQFLERTEQLADKGAGFAKKVGNYMVDGFQYLALFVIGATIVWSAASTYMGMIGKGVASVDDILLLFIFLELGAMVGIYFKTNHLPVQFLLYVAITVMTRSLASTLSIMDMPDQRARDHGRYLDAGHRGSGAALRLAQNSALHLPCRAR